MWYLNSIPLSLLSSEPGAESPPNVKIGSSIVTVVEFTVVVVPLTVRLPATATLAPSNVKAVVVPDLIIKLPEVFVALPNVVPASLKNISPPSASNIISVVASKVKSPPESISAITGVVNVLFVKVSVVALPINVSVAAGKVKVTLPE